jgi:rhomboid protease GluP
MKQLGLKIKLIYLPFILIGIGFVIVYTFLEWLLCIHLKIFTHIDDTTHFLFSFLLPWIPVLIWLRPRLKLLNFSGYRRNPLLMYQMLAVGIIGAVTLNAVTYIEAASGKLTVINNISAINQYEETEYYRINSFYIDKRHPGVKAVNTKQGRYNDELSFSLYCTVPILDTVTDTSNTYCKGWLCISYHKQISNYQSGAEKDTEYKQFLKESQASFDTADLSKFVYLSRPTNNDLISYYSQAMQATRKYSADYKNLLIPVHEAFENRTNSSKNWFFAFIFIGMAAMFIVVFAHRFNEDQLQQFTNGNIPEDKNAKASMRFLLPTPGYMATPILIYLNVIIFLVMAITGSGFAHGETHQFIEWGANYGPLTLNGQWWRLFTCMFLHNGIAHIAMNMIALFFISIFIESSIGTVRYIFAYVVTGILASATSLWWHSNELSVGASGAIMGLFGLFLALIVTKVFRKDFGKQMLSNIILSVVMTIGMGAFSNADNAAHIGGFVSGFLLGLLYTPFIKKELSEDKSSHSEHDLLAYPNVHPKKKEE